ncbi:MAG: hypothetical protein R3E10_04620 [Gemmatimonadota bacterium]
MTSTHITPDARRLVEERRARLESAIGKKLPETVAGDGAAESKERQYLREEALDLYWNELEWENLTEEEHLEGGPLPQLTFPGFLAFVRGLLLKKALPTAKAEAQPRPEVVEDLVAFLAGRVLELDAELKSGEADDAERTRAERAMTSQLLDVVLQTLHEIDPGDL